MPVEKGNKIKIHYTGTFDDGEVFDSSEKHGKPLEFEAGAGMVIKGFDEAVIGMEVGDEKEIHIEPAEAYGERNDQMIQKVPKDKVPIPDAKKGMTVGLKDPNGQQMIATIADVSEAEITLDLNHPLAGKALNFKIKLEGVE